MIRGGILLCALVPAIAAAQNVRVRVSSLAASEPCRADRALAVQLGSIAGIELTEKDADFDAVLERDAANWKVSLRKPDGDIALRRSLSAAKECADVSFAAALVIERFVRALDLKVELPNLRSRADRAREINTGAPRLDAGIVAAPKTGAAADSERAMRTDAGTLDRSGPTTGAGNANAAADAGAGTLDLSGPRIGTGTLDRSATRTQAGGSTSFSDAGNSKPGRSETRTEAESSNDRSDGGSSSLDRSPTRGGAEITTLIRPAARADAGIAATRADSGTTPLDRWPTRADAGSLVTRADTGISTLDRSATRADAGSSVTRADTETSRLDRSATRADAGSSVIRADTETSRLDRPATRADAGSVVTRADAGTLDAATRTDAGIAATRADAERPDAVVSAIGRTRESPQPEPPAARTPAILTRFELAAGGGLWLNDLTAPRPAFEASAGVFLWKRVRIAAQFALASDETIVIPGDGTTNRGDFTTQPFLAALDVGVCFSPRVFRICGSAVGGTHFESGTARGDFVYKDGTTWLARPTFGLDLQLAWIPVRALVLSLSGTALYTPGNTAWSVEGLEAQFGKSFPHFEGLLHITVGVGADRG